MSQLDTKSERWTKVLGRMSRKAAASGWPAEGLKHLKTHSELRYPPRDKSDIRQRNVVPPRLHPYVSLRKVYATNCSTTKFRDDETRTTMSWCSVNQPSQMPVVDDVSRYRKQEPTAHHKLDGQPNERRKHYYGENSRGHYLHLSLHAIIFASNKISFTPDNLYQECHLVPTVSVSASNLSASVSLQFRR